MRRRKREWERCNFLKIYFKGNIEFKFLNFEYNLIHTKVVRSLPSPSRLGPIIHMVKIYMNFVSP